MTQYESPITLFAGEMQTTMEANCLKVVQSYGFDVNAKELAKALAYDRDQYDKGYADARKKYERPHGKWLGWINEIWGGTTIYCSNCKIDALRDKNNHFVKSNFCPNCGADMREEDLSDDGCGGY